jgi:DNA-binding NarL/FixJ family response regulator
MEQCMTIQGSQRKPERNKRKVFIVDDHPVVRDGLTALINHENDLIVCGEAGEARQALKSIAELKPDVIIVDITLGDEDGIELTKDIKVRHPELPVIVLSMHDESVYAERVLCAGARAYLMKDAVSDKVITAIRTVLGGEIYVSDIMTRKLLRKLAGNNVNTIKASTDNLTDRELEVFRWIGQGHKPSRIAKSMHLSVKTVETYLARIKEKLSLDNATELLQYAIKWAGSSDKV